MKFFPILFAATATAATALFPADAGIADLSPIVGEACQQKSIDSAFVMEVLLFTNPDGIPSTNDLFATGDSFTSPIASIYAFVQYIDCTIPLDQRGTEATIKYLGNKGILKDTSNLLDRWRHRKK